jgi:TRAP-type transport system small permease protein
MLRFLERTAELLGWLASTMARCILIFIAAILFIQVVLRYVFTASLPWPEEAARYLMIWVVMLGGSLLIKDDQLVTVDFFDKLWPRRILAYRNALFRLLLAGLLGVLFWQGVDLATFSANRVTAALQISWFWPYLAVPVGAGLMLFHMLVLALRDLLRGPPDHQQPTILRAEI